MKTMPLILSTTIKLPSSATIKLPSSAKFFCISTFFKTFFLSMAIMIVFVCLILMGFLFRKDKYDITVLESKSIDYIVNNANTFDLIGFQYKGVSAWFVKIFTRSFWSHVGLIYTDTKTKIKYVVEIVHRNTNASKKLCVTMRPLKEWLLYHEKQYRNCALLWVQSKIDNKTTTTTNTTHNYTKLCSKLKRLIYEYRVAKMENNPWLWNSTLSKNKTKPSNVKRSFTDSFFCSDFIAYLLYWSGALKLATEQIFDSKYYKPADLLFELPSIYQKPIIIK